MTEYLGIGRAGGTDISILAIRIRDFTNGTTTFEVINGGWRGCIDRLGNLRVSGEDNTTPGFRILWRGQLPLRVRTDCIEAMAYVEREIIYGT